MIQQLVYGVGTNLITSAGDPALGARATARLRLERQGAQPAVATLGVLDPGEWRPEQPASDGVVKVA